MNVVQLIFIFCLCSNSVTGQACDSSSNHTQCSEGELCVRDVCETASWCMLDSIHYCRNAPELSCRSDYCQPDTCDFTGQCVHGQVCAQRLICAYPILYNVEEGSDLVLMFAEPPPLKGYQDIQWVKGTEELYIVVFIGPQPMYYRTLCPDEMSCVNSHRAELNTTTGDLTIRNVTLRDEDFYYYYYNYIEGIDYTAHKYEYYIHVNVDPEVTIQGTPEGLIKVGTDLTLTCTVQKVNPETTDLYWVISGNNHTGSVEAGPDGTFSKNSIYMHRVAEGDEGNPITCVVVPRFGQTVTVEKTVNLGYAPTGKPVIQVSTKDQYKGEKVTLTCENPPSSGKPGCDLYTWTRLEGNINFTPETQTYTFIMDEFNVGSYTCQCRNQFGESEISDEVEIVYLGERPENSSKDNVGLIAGCVIGVIVLVALVVMTMIVCKKFKNKNLQSRNEGENTNKAQVDDYEKPANHRSAASMYEYINESAMARQSGGVVDQEDGYEHPVKTQRSVNRSERAPSNVSLYDYIDEGRMARPSDGGYVNILPTYEDVL